MFTSGFGEHRVALSRLIEANEPPRTARAVPAAPDARSTHLIANRRRTSGSSCSSSLKPTHLTLENLTGPQSHFYHSPAHRTNRLVNPLLHRHLLHLFPPRPPRSHPTRASSIPSLALPPKRLRLFPRSTANSLHRVYSSRSEDGSARSAIEGGRTGARCGDAG